MVYLKFPGGCNLGCTDPNAQNYDANAVTDNGSCMYSCTENIFVLNLIDLEEVGRFSI